jgi:hypothetical protein
VWLTPNNNVACYKVHIVPSDQTNVYCTQEYVCADVSLEDPTYYTHHKKMITPFYVGIDVPSDDLSDWMTCNTCHSKTVAPHYVCADVSSDYSDHWMT